MAGFNVRVAEGISSLFGQDAHADCSVIFCLEHPTSESGDEPQASSSGRKRGRESIAECATVGEPLPAHSFVLRFASDKLAAQLDWPANTDASRNQKPSSKKAKGRERRATTQLKVEEPQLEVLLGSAAELPAARAAIQFAYTGRVEAGSIREALQVRRQAAYLQMEGCAAACLAAVREKLATGAGSSAGAAAATGAAEAKAAGSPATAWAMPAVLELYGCTDVWPEPDEDAAFAALLTEAKQQLVAHFGDALAVLNNKERREQMRALPAVGMEALLESDDFGTDSESSVVLMLAEWMDANHSTTDVATRQRLCGLLRLACCSRAYLCWVLPALAARHTDAPLHPAGWLAVTPQQLTCVANFSTAPEGERKVMSAGLLCKLLGATNSRCWLSTQPRRRCLSAEGRTFAFAVRLEQLTEAEQLLAAALPGAAVALDALVAGAPGGGDGGGCVAAEGLEWRPSLEWRQGTAAAGLFLRCAVPLILLRPPGQPLSALMSAGTATVPHIRLCVHSGAAPPDAGGGKRAKTFQAEMRNVVISLGNLGLGFERALPLKPASEAIPQRQQQGQQQQQERQAAAEAAVRWAAYLWDGKVNGALTLLPPKEPQEQQKKQ